jgi:hypothetical protein
MTFPGTAAVPDGARVVVLGTSPAYNLAHLGCRLHSLVRAWMGGRSIGRLKLLDTLCV